MQHARVVSAALEVPRDPDGADGPAHVAYNLDNICEALERAGRWDPDFVCFPELMLHRWTSRETRKKHPEPVPGTATDRIGDLAARLDTYVWLPLHEGDGDTLYNSVVLIGPDGDVRGTHRKLRPTAGEISGGIDPGDEVTTWDTEFGRVGALICFDLKFHEIGVELARQNAKLVFFPTHLHGRKRLKFWASEHGYHIVKSHPSVAEIATPTGDIVACNEGLWATQEPVESLDAGGDVRYTFAELNPDWEVFGRTPENRQAVEEIQAAEPDVVYHDRGHDEIFALESRAPDVTVADLVAEYDMEPYRDWLDRTGRAAVDTTEDARIGLEDYPQFDESS